MSMQRQNLHARRGLDLPMAASYGCAVGLGRCSIPRKASHCVIWRFTVRLLRSLSLLFSIKRESMLPVSRESQHHVCCLLHRLLYRRMNTLWICRLRKLRMYRWAAHMLQWCLQDASLQAVAVAILNSDHHLVHAAHGLGAPGMHRVYAGEIKGTAKCCRQDLRSCCRSGPARPLGRARAHESCH